MIDAKLPHEIAEVEAGQSSPMKTPSVDGLVSLRTGRSAGGVVGAGVGLGLGVAVGVGVGRGVAVGLGDRVADASLSNGAEPASGGAAGPAPVLPPPAEQAASNEMLMIPLTIDPFFIASLASAC
jgi:hypothetical protein